MVMALLGKSISHRKLSFTNGRKVPLDIIKPYFFHPTIFGSGEEDF
jgi:hypothetical protein